MGLWHGANWTFLIWGFYHALIIFLYRLIGNFNLNISNIQKRIIGLFFTLPLVMISWIPFRSNSLSECFDKWLKLINPYNYLWLGLRENTYLIAFLILISFFIIHNIKKIKITKSNKIYLYFLDTVIFSFIFLLTFIFLRPINQFIYFQF